MAWSWKQDWWKVALGIVAVVATGGLAGAGLAAAGASAGLAAAGGIVAGAGVGAAAAGIIEKSESIEAQNEQLNIERENQKLQYETAFNNALATFDDIKGKYDLMKYVTIPKLEEDIAGYEANIENFDLTKEAATDDIIADIETVDDLLGNWQLSYDAQTKSAQAQGKDTLLSLLSNWSDAEVAAADRGMGGSMQLIARQEKAKAIDYAGADLSLAGIDGVFGASYGTLVAQLESQRDEYNRKLGTLRTDLSEVTTRLDTNFGSWERSLTSSREALGINQGTLDSYIVDLEEQYRIAKENADKLGTPNDLRLKEKRSTIDRLKGLI